ncbi:hypothetical protein PtA15_2A496 [Puccinia triticina]|uniref:Vacuolar ATPase assembly protein VMA22 n=1 Tax=Puccinia triticina TaxID=208348 RepID=A0ABY7CAL8_9BASI|nr:uncharacterized protein PtA15_2A496 [Puccinia triticina]WAQ82180.1 hypothetical protein PtA15_2A496 [Puccinia triticina]WAR53037.1 hypothetical protein PtB15_2B465 [Puccinia triticina]
MAVVGRPGCAQSDEDSVDAFAAVLLRSTAHRRVSPAESALLPPTSMARSTGFQLASSLSKKWTTTTPNNVQALDQYLLTYLNLLDHYNQSHDDLQAQIQAAFLDLSKAKVVLGPSRVGPNSYDLSSRPFVLAVNRYEARRSPETTDHAPGESSLRKRRPEPAPSQTDLPADLDSPAEKGGQEPRALLPNPILQFAPLPPPPLRSAQSAFSRSLDLLVRLANLRHVLSELEQSIHAQKQLVQSAADPPNQ